jgi:hypothetical protein
MIVNNCCHYFIKVYLQIKQEEKLSTIHQAATRTMNEATATGTNVSVNSIFIDITV